MGVVRVRRPVLEFYTRDVKSPQRLMLETSNFVHGSAMRSLSFVMSEFSLSWRGQDHVSNFYTVDFWKISPQQVVVIQVIYTPSTSVLF